MRCNFVGVPYEVKTYTADERGAGTSANVYIQLYGKEIITEEIPLCNKRDRDGKFKRGKMDLFTVEVRKLHLCFPNFYPFETNWGEMKALCRLNAHIFIPLLVVYMLTK